MKTKEIKTIALIGAAGIATVLVSIEATSTVSAREKNNINNKQTESKMEQKETAIKLPTADKWVSTPVRNRLILELDKPVSEVWALVGNPGKMNEYSSGLEKVDTKISPDGKCAEYTCYFKSMGEGMPGIVHRSEIKWFEKNKGWASMDDEPNDFGLTDALTLITFKERDGHTLLIWTQNYDSPEIELNKGGFKEALEDIANQLVDRFGGRVLENYVEE